MKCSECSRRNSDTNTFCIYCGAALSSPHHSKTGPVKDQAKVILPPQDIDELISDRSLVAWQKKSPHSRVHPGIAVTLAIILGLSGVYYWFFYRDTFQILAIDYQTNQLINE